MGHAEFQESTPAAKMNRAAQMSRPVLGFIVYKPQIITARVDAAKTPE
jgi:hypothetical protein